MKEKGWSKRALENKRKCERSTTPRTSRITKTMTDRMKIYGKIRKGGDRNAGCGKSRRTPAYKCRLPRRKQIRISLLFITNHRSPKRTSISVSKFIAMISLRISCFNNFISTPTEQFEKYSPYILLYLPI